MKRLVIDVDSVVQYYTIGRLSGIGRTTIELVRSLDNFKCLPFEIILFSQNMKGVGAKNIGTNFKYKHLYLPLRDAFSKIASRLRLREVMTGYDIIHIPHNYEIVHHPEKCILTIHDAIFMHMHEAAFAHDSMSQKIPVLARKVKHIVTCSEYSKKDIIETMGIEPDKISVIYWGIDHDTFHYRDNIADLRTFLTNKFGICHPYILSVSCNAERKRTDYLVRAYIKYSEINDPIFDLVLVWSDPPESIHSLISNSNVSDRIHFLKNISNKDLAYCYNCAGVMMLPTSYEGFGLPIIEAMASGTPVFTCHNSCLDEIGSNIAFYFDDNLEVSIIDNIHKLEQGRFDFSETRKRGIAWAKQFTWNRTAQQYVEMYKKVLADK